jgi:hypothetical protein
MTERDPRYKSRRSFKGGEEERRERWSRILDPRPSFLLLASYSPLLSSRSRIALVD